MVYFEEVEVGPHFITFYTKDLRGMESILPGLWAKFKWRYPKLVDINHPDFKHWEKDPLVYHRFGEPNHFRAAFRHFHINTDSRPTPEQISRYIDFLAQNGGSFNKVVIISNLEDNKLNPDDYYPPRLTDEDYMDYIERLKHG